jgi:hypothetical protein
VVAGEQHVRFGRQRIQDPADLVVEEFDTPEVQGPVDVGIVVGVFQGIDTGCVAVPTTRRVRFGESLLAFRFAVLAEFGDGLVIVRYWIWPVPISITVRRRTGGGLVGFIIVDREEKWLVTRPGVLDERQCAIRGPAGPGVLAGETALVDVVDVRLRDWIVYP